MKEQKEVLPETDQAAPAPSNAFVRVLQVHDKGEVANLMADALRQAVEAVAMTGKPATITLTAKVLPAARAAYAIEFAPVKLKLPAVDAPRSLWYSDDEHRLHREDPKQKDLPLKTLPETAPQDVRRVS